MTNLEYWKTLDEAYTRAIKKIKKASKGIGRDTDAKIYRNGILSAIESVEELKTENLRRFEVPLIEA